MSAHGTVKGQRAGRSARFILGAVALLLVSVLSLFFTVRVRPAGTTAKSTVLLAKDLVTVTIGDQEINEMGVLLSDDTTEDTVRRYGCSGQVSLDSHEHFPLRSDVMVLEIDNETVCVESRETRKFGDLRLEVVDLIVNPANGSSALRTINVNDAQQESAKVDFRELRYWTVTSGWNTLQSAVAGLLGAFALGLLTNAAYDWVARRNDVPSAVAIPARDQTDRSADPVDEATLT